MDNPPKPAGGCTMIVIGATGDGKSSLCNFILGVKKFKISDDPNSETKETMGSYGIGDAKNIYVIDTPGLHDDKGTDKEHIQQMVDFIKKHKDLQSIIIVFNFMQDRMDGCIRTMLKIFSDIFPIEDFWEHVAIVFTHFIEPQKKNQKAKMDEKRKMKIKRYSEEINKIIRESNTIPPSKFPIYFVDSDLEEVDQKSKEEVNALVGWTKSLDPLNVEKVRAVDDKIKREEEEFKEEIKDKKKIKNIEYITYKKEKRKKQFHYDGSITYTNWEVYGERKEQRVCEKQLVASYNEKLEETDKPIETPEGTKITTRQFQRTVNIYDDGSKVFSKKMEVNKDTKLIKKEDEIKDIKTETKERIIANGDKEQLSKSLIIYKNGKTKVLEDWHVVCTIPSIKSLNNNTKTLINSTTETKIEIEKSPVIVNQEKRKFKGFFLIIPIFAKDTESTVKTVEYKVKYERRVDHFSDNSKVYGEWRKVDITRLN